MVTPETTAAVFINKLEVVKKLQVKLPPTDKRIDPPLNSNTPIGTFTTRENDSFRFIDALRFSVAQINRLENAIELGIEIICQEAVERNGLLPIYVDEDNVLHMGQVSQLKVGRLGKSRVVFHYALSRLIKVIDEFKETR